MNNQGLKCINTNIIISLLIVGAMTILIELMNKIHISPKNSLARTFKIKAKAPRFESVELVLLQPPIIKQMLKLIVL